MFWVGIFFCDTFDRNDPKKLRCHIVRFIMLVPNCAVRVPSCPFLLCWWQIVRFVILVPNCPFAFLVPKCPVLLSGVKLSYHSSYQKVEWMGKGWMGDTPQTVMPTRVPMVLTNNEKTKLRSKSCKVVVLPQKYF